MMNKSRKQIIVAAGTGCALIAFAFYHGHEGMDPSTVDFFNAAAVICLVPVLKRVVRRNGCRKTPRVS